MINAEVFLANLRGSQPILEQCLNVATEDFPEIPLSVVQFLNLGCPVAPVLSHSLSASIKCSMIGSPTCDRVALAAAARQNPDCNWILAAGNGLLIIEVNTQLAMPSLRKLAGGDWRWSETLRFRSGDSRFYAFRHAGRRVRFLGSRYPGLKCHWTGSAVLIPPSWFVFGPPVAWDSHFDAEVLDAPSWLLDE
jgi:hypothetical protein